jgi:hypothetical protein
METPNENPTHPHQKEKKMSDPNNQKIEKRGN